MKRMKKFASLALALVMTLAMMAPVFADGYTITISKALPGNTYTAYKILDLKSYADGKQSYKIADGWADFFSKEEYAGYGTLEGIGDNKTDLTGYVSWKGTDDLPGFAKAAMEYATDKNIPFAGTAKTVDRTDDNYNTEQTVTIDVADLGWYLVDTTNGSLCSLDATTPNANIEEKNPAPSIEKTNDNLDDTMQVGEDVTFTVTVTAQPGAVNYVVHDKMGEGLSLKADTIAVTGSTKDTDYTVVTENLDDGCTFEVSFAKDYLDSIDKETQIVITYKATITEDAVTVEAGKNKAHLSYGDNEANNYTPDKETGDRVYGFDLVKTDSENKVLKGAQFELLFNDEKVSFLKTVGTDGRDIYTACPADTQDSVTTIDAGNVRIAGLGANEYKLHEIKAPDGYNELTEDVLVDLTDKADKDAVVTDGTWNDGGVQVINYTGAQLPSTGGIGTTIFYVVGGILVAGAAILLVTRKRVEEQ